MVVAAGCGGDLVAGSRESVLSSPGFPNNYTNRLNCIWAISSFVDHRISLRFTAMNIEGPRGLA